MEAAAGVAVVLMVNQRKVTLSAPAGLTMQVIMPMHLSLVAIDPTRCNTGLHVLAQIECTALRHPDQS
jgi:hypothetical protein